MSAGVVVVGAGLGGLRTAEGLRRRGFAGPITLAGAERHLPYNRPPLSKEVLWGSTPPEAVVLRSPEALADLDVTVRLGEPARSLDAGRRRILLGDEWLEFDKLVIATGADARSMPGLAPAPNVLRLRTLDDARALDAEFATARHLTIVGAGFIGGEVAASARRRGLEVTMIEALPTPLAHVIGSELGAACAELHREHGVDVRCEVRVANARSGADGRLGSLALTDGSVIETDVVLVAVGAEPNVDWLRGSGLELGRGVRCGPDLCAVTGLIWVVGDVAEWTGPSGEPVRSEHWTNAVEQARTVAENLLREEQVPVGHTACPYFWSDQYDIKMQLVGTAWADEVRIVSGAPSARRMVALCRADERLVGAFTWNEPVWCMRLKRLVERSGSWDEALGLFDEPTTNLLVEEGSTT